MVVEEQIPTLTVTSFRPNTVQKSRDFSISCTYKHFFKEYSSLSADSVFP